MVQAAEPWLGGDTPCLRRLHLSFEGRVAPQAQMRPVHMIVRQVIREDSAQVGLAEHYHVVEALSAYGPNQSLGVRILPGGSWRDHHFLDAHPFHPQLEEVAVDRVAVADEVSRRFVVRKCLDDLSLPKIPSVLHDKDLQRGLNTEFSVQSRLSS